VLTQCLSRTPKADEQYCCRFCDICFESEADAERHTEIWHSHRYFWSCPTIDDITKVIHLQTGPLFRYFFPTDQSPNISNDAVCPYCEGIFTEPDDWTARTQHLELDHCIGKRRSTCKFYRRDQILLHLANCHYILLNEWTREVVDSCRKMECPLVVTEDGLVDTEVELKEPLTSIEAETGPVC
jgi:hypothetical protein